MNDRKQADKQSKSRPSAMPTILVVEDEPMLQEAYKHVLTFKGYTVFTADNGLEGLERLEAERPDIILLDVLMPRLDGIGFLQRADIPNRYPGTKVIACSNLSDQITAGKLAKLGTDRQVLKSDLSPTQLVALVEELSDL